jgi:hypothetical protein
MNNVFKLLILISLFFLLLFPQESRALNADNDTENKNVDKAEVKTEDKEENEKEEIKDERQSQAKGWQGIIIQQIFPNPCGKDENKEWIKLYNSANTEINLKGWFLIDSYGLGGGYLFSEDLWLEDDDYLVLKRETTKITLNNFQEKLYLYTNEDVIADSIAYINAPEDFVYSFENQGFTWKHVNEQKLNSCSSSINKAEDDSDNYNKEDNNIENNDYLGWNDFSEAEKEDEFQITGTVLVAPGDLSTRYFLLTKDSEQSQVIQIYNHYSEFKDINPGDIITATGRFSEAGGFYRIKTNTIDGVEILKSSFLSPPLNFDLNNLNLSKVYSLRAEVYTVNKNNLSVVYDNRKINIDLSLLNEKGVDHNYVEGQEFEFIGLLLKSSDNLYLKLLPHYPQNKKHLSLDKGDNKKNINYKKYLSFLSIISAGIISLKYKKKF